MHELEANADSVNFLITKLCQNIAQIHNLAPDRTAVATLRAVSFGILLKKTGRAHIDENSNFDPQRALEVQIFSAKLNASKGKPQELAKFTKFEEQLENILAESYFSTNETGRGVLQLLVTLQGNVSENEEPMTQSELLVPGPFTLHANYKNNRYYPFEAKENLTNLSPRYFTGIQQIKTKSNPYLPKFIFEEPENKLLALDQKYDIRNSNAPTTINSMSCTFTGMTARLCGAESTTMRVDVGPFGLFANRKPKAVTKQVKKKSIAVVPATTPSQSTITSQKRAKPEKDRIFSWSWESLDCFGIPRSLAFAGETNVTLDLKTYQYQMHGRQFVAKVLTQEQFLKDLKSLTVGIQSDTFQYDAYIVFRMVPNVTVTGVLPATIENYVLDFLECGTCYKRMQTMIMKRDYQLMFEGFMFKALCSAVDEYLLTVRQFVFAQQDRYLIAFYKRMKKMMKQISNFSYTLAIHPNVDDSVKPPMGSQFLGYIYREIIRLTEMDYITLLVFILKRCCHVYFKHLQKWIFYGLLDDPSNELFICFVDHYRQYTKYFYDKAYFVRKESVPGFLQNYEDQILQCGKYTMLLKAYKPNHALFDLEYPSISACLSFKEIQKLETDCFKYFQRAREVCGKPITIRKLFETRVEGKRNFLQLVSQKWREHMERWTDEQRAIAQKASEQKKKRLDELTAQLQNAKARKVAERRANVELELKLLRETERLEEQRLLHDNINLRKRIEYYQEQSDMMKSESSEQIARKQQLLKLQAPGADVGDSRSLQLPQTPLSTAGTDFESCFGDEDASSEYAECISNEFVENFEQNENELNVIFDINEKNDYRTSLREREAVGDANKESKNSVTQTTAPISKQPPTLKRSVSDVINSNELQTVVRAAVGTIDDIGYKDWNTKKSVVTVAAAARPLTEAQRNKIKVLGHEYGTYRDDTLTKSMPDINLNTLPDSQLTDLQRNRRHMMQNDMFSEFNKDPLADRAHLNLELNSELARNRRRVLESEYDILTGQRPSTHTFTVEVCTPMSTTSDTPLTESMVDVELMLPPAPSSVSSCKRSDLQNGNVQEKTKLKLDVQLANVQSQSQQGESGADAALLSVSTAQVAPDPTPESALNTAGLMAKQGFDFDGEEERRKQRQLEVINELPIQNESMKQEEAKDSEQPDGATAEFNDYTVPYKRCLDLLDNNFKCAPLSPYFRLNRAPSPHTMDQPSKSNESLQQRCDLNSMSVITLTEFLQKSVILPMSTHLELVNNEVMRMFLEELHILKHLRSLRHYFFLMDGEFGAIICDGIIGKLEDGETPEKLLNYQMLHSILDTALGSSITGSDKNAENLSFIVSDVPAKFDLSSPGVLNVLSLSYRINWPLNLILNPETLEQYATIFKYLIKVRRISWTLERAYQILKEAVKKHGKNILKSPQYRHVQQIRHKFYHFVHALQNHITASALQASWKTFKDDMLNAKCMEDIYRKHTIYIKRILFLCMLNRRSVEFYNTIENIFKISLRFYNNLQSREFKLRTGQEHFTHSRYEKLASDELEFEKFIKYAIYLGNKIVRHGYQEEIGEFISLINYNQYYMTKGPTSS